jgi:dual specificity tyrosine-phosphorylation-regulated kinase 2/3/4
MSIKSNKKVFRKSSIDANFIPALRTDQSPRQKSLSVTRPSLSRPFTSRTVIKKGVVLINPETNSILPANPETTIKFLGQYLTEFENIEILDYKEIYYIGKASKIQGKINDNNWGYDNLKGDYILIIGDHIDYRYEILDIIGKGTFGQVCKCFDHMKKDLLAIKIIKNKPKLNKQSLIEIKILKYLNSLDTGYNEGIVRMKNFFTFRSHVCIVFELLSMNLYEYSRINMFKQVSSNTLLNIAKQLLRTLKFIHNENVIHCDLKPENILLCNNPGAKIKIIDFGSSCYCDERLYSYIQSRYYRAPEILLGIPYSTGIDMWSIACILVELYIGYPLFPGDSEIDLFGRIVEVLGIPPMSVISQSKRKKVFFDSEDKFKYREKYKTGSRSLVEIVGPYDLGFIDFLTNILVWDQKLRLTADTALNHYWILKSYSKVAKKNFKGSFLRTEIVLNKIYHK